MKKLLALVVTCLLGGCTLILDGKGLYDDAHPDAPSRPVIAIDPEGADTTSTLTVRFVEPSVSPLGEAVTYEYAWSRDGVVVSESSAVPANETERGEEWSVVVTPVGVASGHRGSPGRASVVIRNFRPVVRAGVNNYRPVLGQRVRVVIDEIFDADGDLATPRFRWFANGEPLAGQSSDELRLADVPVSVGDELSVEVFGHDGEEAGDAVTIRGITVRENKPRWESLSPAFSVQSAAAFFPDPSGKRWLFVSRGDLWEMVEQANGDRRVTWLGPSQGPPSFYEATSIVDVENRRAIVFTAGNPDSDDRGEVWALSFEPVAQPWTKLNPGGTVPSARRHSTLVYDAARNRAILYGGIGPDNEILGDFYTLSLTPGEELWAPIPVTDPEPHWGVTMLADPAHDRFLLFSGLPSYFVGDFDLPGRIAELRYDASGTFQTELVRHDGVFPTQALFMGGTVLPSGNEAILAYGVFQLTDKPQHVGVHRVDLTDLTVSTLEIPEDQHVPSEGPRLGYDAERGLVTIWDGFTWEGNGHAIRRYFLDLDAATITFDFGYGREYPGSSWRALATTLDDEVVWFPVSGLSPYDEVSFGDIWRFDMITRKFRRDRIEPDATLDVEPEVFSNELLIALRPDVGHFGIINNGSDAWSIVSNWSTGKLEWMRHEAAAPATMIWGSTSSMWEDTCTINSWGRGNFGAFDSSGTHQAIYCEFTGYNCAWTSNPTVVTNISARSGMASAVAGSTTFLFGGRSGLTALSDVYRRTRTSSCAASFTSVTTNGTAPTMDGAQALWDASRRRFVIAAGANMQDVWFLEFGASGNVNTDSPTWRKLGASDVDGPWQTPYGYSGRIALYDGLILYVDGSGAIYALHTLD